MYVPKALFDKSKLPEPEKKIEPTPKRQVGVFVPPVQTKVEPQAPKKVEPGALFAPVKTAESEISIADKAKYKNFTPIDIAKIKDAVASIDIGDRVFVIQFGQDVNKKLSASVDDILNFVKNSSINVRLELDAKSLHELLNLDPSVEDESLLSIFKKKKTLSERVNELIANVEQLVKSIEFDVSYFLDLVQKLDLLLENSKKYHREILILVAAGQEKISDFRRRQLHKINEQLNSPNVMIVQNARDVMDVFNSFVKRVETLELVSGQNELTLAQIRMTQSTNVKTVEALNNIISNLIPLWKQSLISAISSKNFDSVNKNKDVLSQSLHDIISSKSIPAV